MADVTQGPRGAAANTMRWIDNADGSYSPQVVLSDGNLTFSVDDNGGSLTVDDGGTTISVDDGAGALTIDDGGGSITVDGTVALSSVPASDRTTDNIGAALVTDKIMNDTTELTPKFKSTSIASAATDTTLIAAVTSKKLRILSGTIIVGATATDVTLESDGGSDTLLFKVTPGANGGVVLPFNPVGWFETVAGEALIGTTSSGSSVQTAFTYLEV